ncbi:hypothetical protein [uncultured Desulfuromusa sp.]|nr:hypothetical protein [uncultured Desulfuromusa sp.]
MVKEWLVLFFLLACSIVFDWELMAELQQSSAVLLLDSAGSNGKFSLL